MQTVRHRYVPALTEYIRNGDEASLYQATELGKRLQGVHPEDIIALHDETMQLLAANLEPDETMKLFNRSFIFLIELMVAYRFRDTAEEASETKFAELRRQLVRSTLSFQHVKTKYENILQHMDCGIALFSREGSLTFINLQLANLLGVTRHHLIGRSLRDIASDGSVNRESRRHFIRIACETVRRGATFHEIADQSGRHLLVTVMNGEQLDGDYLVSVKDVTAYKRIEQTAYQNDKLAMLGKISASIAHEIRNPLTSIRGFIQLLRPHLEQLGKEEYARIILTEIDRANDIIYEFLNSSKPTEPKTRHVALGPLLKEVILLSESEALMKGCQLHFHLEEEGFLVSIDAKQIKQVILNIIKNAVDAISELQGSRNGRIDVVAGRRGEQVEIRISDNGKGMAPAVLERLFDPFFTTKESGTGLGLSVSQRIVESHGGEIRVHSRESEGTVFRILLPLLH